MKDIRALRRTKKINYVKKKLLQGYSLKEICKTVDYKRPKHISRAFKQVTGQTIIEYLKKEGVKKAPNNGGRGLGNEANGRLETLINAVTENPYVCIRELALNLGYSKESSVYKLYQRRTGSNLGEFIREEKNKLLHNNR